MKITITFDDGRPPVERDRLDDRLGVLVVAGGDFDGEWLDWLTLVKTTDCNLELQNARGDLHETV